MKNSANPQTVYYDKAKDIRAERIEGVVHLYRMADIVAVSYTHLVVRVCCTRWRDPTQ